MEDGLGFGGALVEAVLDEGAEHVVGFDLVRAEALGDEGPRDTVGC